MNLERTSPSPTAGMVTSPPRLLSLFVAGAFTVVLLAVVFGPLAMAGQPVPALDLQAAQLSSVPQLVTPFQVSAEDGHRTITVIGAYADPARTVLFLRVKPDTGMPNVTVSDEAGMMSSSAYAMKAAPGDYVYALNSGPHTGPDHLAQLKVEVIALTAFPVIAAPPEDVKGSWVLSFAVPVQPAVALPHESGFQLGAWRLTIEVLEATPAVVHLQVAIDGARVEDFGQALDSMITLMDSSNEQVRNVASDAGTTIPKEELNPAMGAPTNTRVNLLWLRPPTSGTYQLRFQANGETHTIAIALPG